MKPLATVFATASLLVGMPSSALGATVGLDREELEEEGETFYIYTAVFNAAAGEANRLTVDISDGQPITFEDSGAPLTAGADCTQLTPNRVSCSPYDAVIVNLRGGDDTATVTGSGPDNFSTPDVYGGGGDDVLTGSKFVEYLFGGEGDDQIDGGGSGDRLEGGGGRDEIDAGADTSGFDIITDGDTDANADGDVFRGDADTLVSYLDRGADITVDLAEGRGGAAGEADTFAGPLHVQGGKGDDRLNGTDSDDFLWGTEGEDILDGRGGDDLLRGDGGADIYLAGDGDDIFQGVEDNASDVLNCGRGADFVQGQDARDVLRSSCEKATWFLSGFGAPFHEVMVQPRVTRRSVRFSVTCKGFDVCRGTARLRLPDRREPLGKGRFKIARNSFGRVMIKLNSRGRRHVRRGGYMRVAFKAPKCRNCANPPSRHSGFTTYIRLGER